MSDPVLIAVITGVCFAAPTVAVSIINRNHVSGKIAEVHLQINSRFDQLLRAEKGLSHAEGMEAQKQQDKRESNGTKS